MDAKLLDVQRRLTKREEEAKHERQSAKVCTDAVAKFKSAAADIEKRLVDGLGSAAKNADALKAMCKRINKLEMTADDASRQCAELIQITRVPAPKSNDLASQQQICALQLDAEATRLSVDTALASIVLLYRNVTALGDEAVVLAKRVTAIGDGMEGYGMARADMKDKIDRNAVAQSVLRTKYDGCTKDIACLREQVARNYCALCDSVQSVKTLYDNSAIKQDPWEWFSPTSRGPRGHELHGKHDKMHGTMHDGMKNDNGDNDMHVDDDKGGMKHVHDHSTTMHAFQERLDSELADAVNRTTDINSGTCIAEETTRMDIPPLHAEHERHP